jgi:glutaredoxin-like YruB-family protein
MEKVLSYQDFLSRVSKDGKKYLLLYKSGSEQSSCAFRNVEDAFGGKSGLYSADVAEVRDIHPVYGITSVPSLLVFADDMLVNIIKGCHDTGYYRALTENAIFRAETTGDGKAAKRVTVYSTPTCSWCNTLKTWLQKNNIRYTDIDVSADQRAADELVRRSGQQGVPQTDINGQIVVGFNQPKLKELLGIN